MQALRQQNGNNATENNANGNQQQQQQETNGTGAANSDRSGRERTNAAGGGGIGIGIGIAKRAFELEENAQIRAAATFKIGDSVTLTWARAEDSFTSPWRVDTFRVMAKQNGRIRLRKALQGQAQPQQQQQLQQHQQQQAAAIMPAVAATAVGQDAGAAAVAAGAARGAGDNNNNNDDGVEFEFPTVDTEDIIVRKIEATPRPPSELPPSLRTTHNFDFARITHIIYCDGGSVKTDSRRVGASASGVCAVDRGTGVVEKHAKYHQRTTNNVAEYIAFVAAMRLAREKYQSGTTIIVTDAEIIYNAWTNGNEPKDLKLRALYEKAKTDAPGEVIVAHMLRAHNNPADDVVKKCIRDAANFGREELFEEAPFEPEPVREAQNAPMRINIPDVGGTVDDAVAQINSVEDFAKIRRYHCRSRCPQGFECAWSHIVKQQCQKIINAPSRDAKDRALIGLMLLPTLFFPTNGSRGRIGAHINQGRAFTINLRDDNRDGACDA